MGREANCNCRYNGFTYAISAHLEPLELIFRGELKKRIARNMILTVEVIKEQLFIASATDQFELELGNATARSWQKAINDLPPTLAQKMGINGETSVLLIGDVIDDELSSALTCAAQVSSETGKLAIAVVDTELSLHEMLEIVDQLPDEPIAIWVVYAKGQRSSVNETVVRREMRAAGYTDIKVTSVSSRSTGLRFVRKSPGLGPDLGVSG